MTPDTIFSDMIGLKWTTEPPMVRGMYQAAFSDGSGVVWLELPADCGKYDPADFSHYLGPIPVADIIYHDANQHND